MWWHMGGKDLGFEVVYRGETRDRIEPGTYVFFQRQKEHGGGFWLGQAYDDWFGFVIEEPVSLRVGMNYLSDMNTVQQQGHVFDDSLDDFRLR